ncbi:MAG: hypothetical protein ABII64_10935 [Elusimicrobiota bacterium]
MEHQLEQDEKEISFQDIGKMLANYWKFILGTSVLVSTVYFLISISLPKQYESYALLKIGFDGDKQIESVYVINEIMKSAPMIEEIKSKVNMPKNTNKGLEVKYFDVFGLLKIVARDESPEKAAQIVQASADIIIDRHHNLHELSQENLGKAVKFVKEMIRPVPLSSGLSEFRSFPTRIAIPPIIDNSPVKPEKRLRTSTLFIIMLLVTTLASFYSERRKNKK